MEFPTKSERGVKGYAACSYSIGGRFDLKRAGERTSGFAH
jgi:hypothetical protein